MKMDKRAGRLGEGSKLMPIRVGVSEIATLQALAKARGQQPQTVIRGIYRQGLDELVSHRQP